MVDWKGNRVRWVVKHWDRGWDVIYSEVIYLDTDLILDMFDKYPPIQGYYHEIVLEREYG